MDVLGIAFSEFTDAERMTEEIMDDRETSARGNLSRTCTVIPERMS
jgi:hypothetical protein